MSFDPFETEHLDRRVRCDRAAVMAVAVVQIYETAPAHECRVAIENYLRDEIVDVQRQAVADYAPYWGCGDA